MTNARLLRGFSLPIAVLLLLAGESFAAGVLLPRDGSRPIEVKSHRVTVVIEGGLARTTLRQTFVNPHHRPLEAIYAFPLPRDAALVDVAMEVNNVRLTGLLLERQRGRKIYNEIVSSQKDPALVEQIGPGTFRLSVFPVVPRKDTVVELTWIQQLPDNRGVCHYVYPLALARGKAKTKQEFAFNLTVKADGGAAVVTSPLKDMEIAPADAGAQTASFTRIQAGLDQDVVVNIAREVQTPTVRIRTFRRKTGDGWFQITVTTPKAKAEYRLPLDLTLVIDNSRSMRGEKLERAKEAALKLIDGLRPGDSVNVVGFSSKSNVLSGEPLTVTDANVVSAWEFVKGLKAEGGTALGDALEQALRIEQAADRARIVVLFTDGVPTMGLTDPQRIIDLARSGGARGLRIFAFGLGDDVNPVLLAAMARASNGRAVLCRSGEDLKTSMDGFLEQVTSPALDDVKIIVPGALIRDVFPRPAPVGFLGEQISFVGRYREGGEFPVTLLATIGAEESKLTRTLEFRKEPGGSGSVMQLFARQKLALLEEQYWLQTGLSQEACFAALDAGAYSAADTIVKEMIEVSLTHGVQCLFTSFLVLLPEDRHRVDPDDTEAIARARERAAQAQADGTTYEAPPAAGAPEVAPNAADGEAGPPPAPDSDSGEAQEADPAKAGGDSGSGEEDRPPGSGSNGDSGDNGDSGGGDDGGEGDKGNGGSYRGCAGGVPPGDRDPNGPRPPDENPDDSSPPDDDAGSVDPTTPQAGGPPTIAGGAGSRPGRKRTSPKTITYDHWLFWWAYNKDEILHRRWQDLDLARTGVVIPEALPALRTAAKNRRLNRNVRSGAIVSLGRAGDPADGALLRELLEQESSKMGLPCALALGLVGEKSPETRELLFRIGADAALPTATRSAALIAVGLIGFDDDATLLRLMAVVGMPSASVDLPVSALLAIGLVGSAKPVPELITWFQDGRIGRKRLSDLERAWVAEALGRIGDPRAARPLLTALRTKRTSTKRSVAIALGRLLPACEDSEQAACADLLTRYVRAGKDVAAVNFSVISLGRLAAAPTVALRIRKSLARFLLAWYEHVDGKSIHEPFAALALGLAAPAALPRDRERFLAALTRRLEARKGDRMDLGAVAIALGLAGDDRPETVALLSALVSDRGLPPKLRGAAATALGLLGAKEGAEAVLRTLAERGGTALEVETAAATALLGDRRATPLLLSSFQDARASSFALGSAALALGRIGDRTALPALIDLLEPEKVNGRRPNLARALAAQAIGFMADSTGGGALTRLSFDLNYRAMVPALSRILSWQ